MNENFRIGVMIAMSSNAEAVLSAMGSRLMGLRREVKLTEEQMHGLGKAAIGAMAIFTGVEVLEGIAKIINKGKELNEELQRTKQLGGEFAKNVNSGSTLAAAMRVQQQVPTFDAAQIVRMKRELGTQGLSDEEVNTMLPEASRIAQVVSHFTGENTEEIVKNLIKVADIRAKIFTLGLDGKEHVDPAKVNEELGSAMKGLILGGNYLKSNDLLQMARMGGVAAKLETAEAFYAAGVEMAISQGASRTGTAESSLFSQLVGGHMTMQTAKEMQKYGLLKPGELHSDHGHVIIDGSATKRAQVALADPIAYIEGELNDQMDKKHLTQQEKIAEVYALFGRETTRRLVAEALSNAPQFARARSMFHDIPDAEKQFSTLMNEDLDTNLTALSASWKTFMEVFGSAGIPVAIHILHELTGAVQGMSQWAAANPDTAKVILEVAAAIGVSVAVGGAVTLVAAIATLGGPAVGIAGAAAGIAGLGVAIAFFGDKVAAILAFLPGAGVPKIGPDGKPITPEEFQKKRGENLWYFLHPDAEMEEFKKSHGGQTPEEYWMHFHGEPEKERTSPKKTVGVTDMNGPSELSGGSSDDAEMLRKYLLKVNREAHAHAADDTGTPGRPLHVYVVNGRDLTASQMRYIEHELSLPPSGSPQYEPRATVTHGGATP